MRGFFDSRWEITVMLVTVLCLGWQFWGGERIASAAEKRLEVQTDQQQKLQGDKDRANQKKTKVFKGQKLDMKKTVEATYLINKNGKKQSGWYVRIGKIYQKLGKVSDIGLYKTNKVTLIYADNQGELPVEKEVSGVPFDEEGYPSKAKGIYQIQGQYYFINEGNLQTQDVTYNKVKYYINMDGSVAFYKWNNKCYTPSGKKMNTTKKMEAQARYRARRVIRILTKKSMSKKQKLETCFQWVVQHYGYYEYKCNGKKGWTSKLGYQMLTNGSGDCRVLAAGFAFLASELGYDEVYICQDSKDKFSGSHCWTQVDGKCYDPLFYNTAKPKRYLSVFHGSAPKEYYEKTHCTASRKFRPGA